MSKSIVVRFGIAVMLTCGGHDATATTQTTFFDTLNASTSVVNSVNAGDTLFVDTLVRSETGALSQSVTFSLGAGVTGMTGLSAWMVSTAAGAGPRLVGFNIDLFDASTNALIASDTAPSVSGGSLVPVWLASSDRALTRWS